MKDENLLSIKLDNIVLDGRKIFANLPRFKGLPKEEVTQGLRIGVKGKEVVVSKEGSSSLKKHLEGRIRQRLYMLMFYTMEQLVIVFRAKGVSL